MTSHYFEHTHVSDGQRNSREVTEGRHRQIDAVAHINGMSVSQRTLARLMGPACQRAEQSQIGPATSEFDQLVRSMPGSGRMFVRQY